MGAKSIVFFEHYTVDKHYTGEMGKLFIFLFDYFCPQVP